MNYRHTPFVLLVVLCLLFSTPTRPADASALRSELSQLPAPTARQDFDWLVVLTSTRAAWDSIGSSGYRVARVLENTTSDDLNAQRESITTGTDGLVVFMTPEIVKSLRAAKAFKKNQPLRAAGRIESVSRTGLCHVIQRRRGNCNMLILQVLRAEPLEGSCATTTRGYRIGGRWGLSSDATLAACHIGTVIHVATAWSRDVSNYLHEAPLVQAGTQPAESAAAGGNSFPATVGGGRCKTAVTHRFDAKDDGKKPFVQSLSLRHPC